MCDARSVRCSRPSARTVILALIVALGLSLQGTARAQPIGAEFQVNTYTYFNQGFGSVAADADGDFVVVWDSSYQDGSSYGVFGQRYTSAGAAAGAEFQVNTYTTQRQQFPAVAADADGDFVVVWESRTQDGNSYGVFGQRYTSAGAAAGAEFQVNTYTTSYQHRPAVAVDADGDFVVVWDSFSQDGSNYGVFGQRYTSAGAAAGAEFQVNTYTTLRQLRADVAAEANGDFVVVWDSSSGQDGSGYGIFGQRYTSAGAAIGAEFQVNTYTTDYQTSPAVAADADGDFVVVWQSSSGDGSSYSIRGRRFTSAGAGVGSDFQVNTYTTGFQGYPAVAADADGNFVVAWTSYYVDYGNNYGVLAKRFTNAGATVGSEFQVNTYTGDQTTAYVGPAVAADADGDFVVAWTAYYPADGNGYAIFAQRFQPIVGSTTTTTTTTSTTTTLPPPIPVLSSGGGLLLGVLLMLPMLWGSSGDRQRRR